MDPRFALVLTAWILPQACTAPGALDDDDSTEEVGDNLRPDPTGVLRVVGYLGRSGSTFPGTPWWFQSWSGDITLSSGGGAAVSWVVNWYADEDDLSDRADCPMTGSGLWDGTDGDFSSTMSIHVSTGYYAADCVGGTVGAEQDPFEEAVLEHFEDLLIVNVDDVPETWEPAGGLHPSLQAHAAALRATKGAGDANVTHAVLVQTPGLAPPTGGIEPWTLFAYVDQRPAR